MNSQQAINLLNGLEQRLDDYCELNNEGKAAFRMAITALELFGNAEQLPSAQPEQKKGEWLRYGEDGYPNNEDTVFWQCDQCLEQYTGRAKKIPNFCPNCGAKMDS